VIADFDTGPLLLIFILLLIAATMVLLSVVGKLQGFGLLRDFDQCNADAADADSLISEAWATPGAMKRAMHIGAEHWPVPADVAAVPRVSPAMADRRRAAGPLVPDYRLFSGRVGGPPPHDGQVRALAGSSAPNFVPRADGPL
jgi:hypothetical protein